MIAAFLLVATLAWNPNPPYESVATVVDNRSLRLSWGACVGADGAEARGRCFERESATFLEYQRLRIGGPLSPTEIERYRHDYIMSAFYEAFAERCGHADGGVYQMFGDEYRINELCWALADVCFHERGVIRNDCRPFWDQPLIARLRSQE